MRVMRLPPVSVKSTLPSAMATGPSGNFNPLAMISTWMAGLLGASRPVSLGRGPDFRQRGSDREADAAAAAGLGVGVADPELGAGQFVHEVDL